MVSRKPSRNKIAALFRSYFKVLGDLYEYVTGIEEMSVKRKSILSRVYGELGLSGDKMDTESKIKKIVGKTSYPNIFLGSSVKFSKSQWNKQIEKILEMFSLGRQLKYPTKENVLKYDKLKNLILKIQKKQNKSYTEDS